MEKIPVHIEICMRNDSAERFQMIEEYVATLLSNQDSIYSNTSLEFSGDEYLQKHVETIEIILDSSSTDSIPWWKAEVYINTFQLDTEIGCNENLELENGESLSMCDQWVLPNAQFQGLWSSLIYDSTIKTNLLNYSTTAMLFSDALVDPNIISWNRVVLLHGPPGTGKTSLCKAIAQKLSIRLSKKYSHSILLEINAHSLFSKWFSESGKLVMRLFNHIEELIEDENAFVCVLIDEVESLSAARKSAMSGTEPSDAIRVVNALLTQIDQLSRRENVLLLTTSNLTGAIDIAFIDRADIKQYIGPPSQRARYTILKSCVLELVRSGIIQILPSSSSNSTLTKKALGSVFLPYEEVHQCVQSNSNRQNELGMNLLLYNASVATEGFNGRALRKLPVQTHAFFIHRPTSPLAEFLSALQSAAKREHLARLQLSSDA